MGTVKLACAVVILGVFGSLTCMAEDDPALDLFGGYSYLNASTEGLANKHVSLNGWNAAGTFYLNHWFGIASDFSGHYGTPSIGGTGVTTHVHNFLFGPQFSYRHGPLTPFAHALFGESRVSAEAGGIKVTDSDFGMALGGGIDVKLHPRMSWRMIEADYLRTQFFNNSQNHARISTGLVFHFGNR